MSGSYLDELSIALINRAERDCAEQDPGMADAAAMVLVGDIYALHVCRRAASPAVVAPTAPAHRRDDGELSPFIR